VSHARFRKFPLYSVGACFRTDGSWQCRDFGLSIDLTFGREKYWLRFADIPPRTTVEIVEFLRKAKWDGKPARSELAETMTLGQVQSRPDEFWLQVEYDNEFVMISVERVCHGRRCRHRLINVSHNRFTVGG